MNKLTKNDLHLPWAELIPSNATALDWQQWSAAVPDLCRLDHTVQDPIHHAEGDVGTHTRMCPGGVARRSVLHGGCA